MEKQKSVKLFNIKFGVQNRFFFASCRNNLGCHVSETSHMDVVMM